MDIIIDKNEVLRYLGHKGQEVPKNIQDKVDSIIQECKNNISPKYVNSIFDIKPVSNGVEVINTGFVMAGEDIKKHLTGCEKCIIFCATIGVQAENFIRKNAALSALDGMIADSVATTAIESFCDNIENALRLQIKQENKFLTWRYSCGYGDFPFTQQPDILKLLNATKYTGVTCNESAIMIPRKSVTAIMGIAGEKPHKVKNKCDSCANKNNCNFSCR